MAKKITALAGYTAVDKKDIQEIDYVDKLTDEERHWLYRFLDNEKKAIFYGDGKDLIADKSEQKRLAREKKRRQIDFYGQCNVIDDSQSQPTLQPRTPKKCQPKPAPALPVRHYTPEELEAFKNTYKPGKK